ncbi:MAG: MFS transporter, partial [Halomonadaceae bacterium]|nr:MFS transporter [Halomonadaceae bacterium]
VAFFTWRRSVRPAPLPVAPFSPSTPMSPVGAELTVTEELVQGAIEHEHIEDLSGVVAEVEVVEPLVGPPPPDEPHIAYYADEEEASGVEEPLSVQLKR